MRPIQPSDANVGSPEHRLPAPCDTALSENICSLDAVRDSSIEMGIEMEGRGANFSTGGNKTGRSLDGTQIPDLKEDKRLRQSMYRKMKKFGAKVRKLVHSLLPSAGVRDEDGVKTRVNETDSRDVVVNFVPQFCLHTLTRAIRFRPVNSLPPCVDQAMSKKPRRTAMTPNVDRN